MTRYARLVLPIALALAFAAPRGAAAEPPPEGTRIAFFGLAFVDLSTEGALYGERADQTERVHASERQVRAALEEAGLVFVDLAPFEAELARVANPARCNGCEMRIAARAGAEFALVGEVRKVSNLILSMDLALREVPTGKSVRGLAVDIRGNTDESWAHGIRYILRNAILK